MSVPVWPQVLPRPTRSAYRASFEDPRMRRTAETGLPGYRRRWSSVARSVGLSIIVSRSGKGSFDRFYAETTGHGSLPFRMPDPVTDGWPCLTGGGDILLDGAGRPIAVAARWLCLFGNETPVESIRRGVEFEIAFSVVVMP